MSYITNQEIIDRVGNDKAAQLTTDSGTVPSTTVLNEIRLSTEGEVNGYLAKRYKVPIDMTTHTELDAVLTGFVLDVAVYRMHARRPPIPDDVGKARDQAIKWLEKVSRGEIVLPAATTPASATADKPYMEHGSNDPNISTMRDH